jgi:hypothetical protein
MFVVAALVDGSGGSIDPLQAEACVDRFLRGEDNDYSERCVALYEFDLVEMMFDDVMRFSTLDEVHRRSVIASCERAVTEVRVRETILLSH